MSEICGLRRKIAPLLVLTTTPLVMLLRYVVIDGEESDRYVEHQ